MRDAGFRVGTTSVLLVRRRLYNFFELRDDPEATAIITRNWFEYHIAHAHLTIENTACR